MTSRNGHGEEVRALPVQVHTGTPTVEPVVVCIERLGAEGNQVSGQPPQPPVVLITGMTQTGECRKFMLLLKTALHFMWDSRHIVFV